MTREVAPWWSAHVLKIWVIFANFQIRNSSTSFVQRNLLGKSYQRVSRCSVRLMIGARLANHRSVILYIPLTVTKDTVMTKALPSLVLQFWMNYFVKIWYTVVEKRRIVYEGLMITLVLPFNNVCRHVDFFLMCNSWSSFNAEDQATIRPFDFTFTLIPIYVRR